MDKMEGMNIRYGLTGAPIILNDSLAYLDLKVVKKIDVGTHWMFIGELVDAQLINDENDPITYAYYREVRKGVSPKNAPTYRAPSEPETENSPEAFSRYECSDCGYIYDEKIDGVKFVDLPDDWVCPVCGAPKSDFIRC
jgi:rubredoxin